MVLGVDPVVPSRLICDSGIPPSPEEMKGLVKHLEASPDYPAEPTSNHNPTTNEYMPTTTETATHSYIKVDNPKGLMQSYVRPYEIVERPSLSAIHVKMGTLKSGVANLQLHHWSNAKPAAMRDNAIFLSQMMRGCPPKRTSSSDNVGHTIDASEAANEQQTKNRNKSKQAVIPTTGSAEPTDTIAHATSNKVWCKPVTGARITNRIGMFTCLGSYCR